MKLTRKQIEHYFENECAFRDYEFRPIKQFGKLSKARSVNLLEPTIRELEDALRVFVRDGFGTIVCYVGTGAATKSEKRKRIKQVFSSSSQVFHLWANQSQQYARQGGRITRAFFKGTKAYSYGHHYLAGEIKKYRGVTVAVINSNKRSNTTSKHTSEAASACRGLMPVVQSSTMDVFDGLIETQDSLINDLFGNFNSRKFWFDWNLKDFKESFQFTGIQEFNRTCKNLKHPELMIEIDSTFLEILSEHVAACKAREVELNSPEALAKRAEAETRKHAEYIDAWKAGLKPRNNVISNIQPQLIRVNAAAGVVETSGGAQVPLIEAKALLRNVLSKKVQPGEQIGAFRVTRVENGIVQIGCHRIEIEHAKQVLGNIGLQVVAGGKS